MLIFSKLKDLLNDVWQPQLSPSHSSDASVHSCLLGSLNVPVHPIVMLLTTLHRVLALFAYSGSSSYSLPIFPASILK